MFSGYRWSFLDIFKPPAGQQVADGFKMIFTTDHLTYETAASDL